MSKKETLEATEKALDSIEGALDTIVPETVEAVQVVKNNTFLIVGVALIAASIGAAIGYKVAEKRLMTKFDAIVEEEIEKTRRHYAILNKHGDYSTPEKAVQQLIPDSATEAKSALSKYRGEKESVVDYSGGKVMTTEEDGSVTVESIEETEDSEGDDVEIVRTVSRNIFVDGKPLDDDNFDYDAEVANRSEDFPYVITEEEFFQNEQEFVQLTCTYYEGDDVLVDEQDMVIDDVEGSVGVRNLTRFGHGSKDKHLVYIRNNKRGTDFEIARSKGTYLKEVLGMDPEDNSRANLRFRGGDD